MEPRRGVALGAAVALVGAITSGPLSLWLLSLTHAQPAWKDAATFAAAYRPGPASVVPAIAAAGSRDWVTSPLGLAAFGAWNVLVVAMTGAALVVMRRRARAT